MVRLTRKTFVGWKAESTEGTDASLGNADHYLAEDVEISYESDETERRSNLGDLTQLAPVTGGIVARATFTTEIYGSGTAGTSPDHGDLFQACGLEETVVASTSVSYKYSSASADHDTVSLYIWKDGLRHKILGARGTATLRFEAGLIGKIDWDFAGQYEGDPAEATNPTPTYATVVPPVALGTTFTVDSTSLVGRSLDLSLDNANAPRRSFTATYGYDVPKLADRLGSGNFTIEAPALSTLNAVNKWRTKDVLDGSFSLGSAGNTLTVGWKMALNVPSFSDQDGISNYDIPFQLTADPNSTTAYDEEDILVLTYT